MFKIQTRLINIFGNPNICMLNKKISHFGLFIINLIVQKYFNCNIEVLIK